MADYGQPVRFGVFADPSANQLEETLRIAAVADTAGLDVIGIQDHPYQRRHLDTVSLLATVLARTSRVTVFPDVANVPLRPPAVLAKTAASLDVISGGRFELGLGAGGFWEAIGAMGGPVRSVGEARAALSEAIDITRLMWSGERSIRYDGKHYQVAGVKPGPQPAHDMDVWLGVNGPKALALLGEKADGWVPSAGYVPPSQLGARHEIIDAAAVSAGRDPRRIRRVYNVWGALGGPSVGFLNGTVDQWVEDLSEIVLSYGMDTFVFGPDTGPNAPSDGVRQVELFAAEVAPAVRRAVQDVRSPGD